MRSQVLPKQIIQLFFIIGIFSAMCFRGLILIHTHAVEYYRLVWYCGAIGYMCFFGFRFYISYKRRRTIRENSLIDKISQSTLNQNDKENVEYILQSLMRSKEMINFVVIFIMSLVAITIDILT